jgi:hypothetical protein
MLSNDRSRSTYNTIYHEQQVQISHPVPGGYKYGNLALQVGGVSDETVNYGSEFCGTSTQE